MCVITSKDVKYHLNKLWSSEKRVAFFVSRTAKLPSKVSGRRLLSLLGQNLFLQIQLCCLFEVKSTFPCHSHLFDFTPKLARYRFEVCAMFSSSICLVYKTGSSFIPLHTMQ